MAITFNTRKLLCDFRAKRFLKSKAQEYLVDEEKKDIDIVTIAFNNDMVIKYQIELIKKNLGDNYCYTVVDNSNDNLVAEKIKKLCLAKNVGYIKLAKNENTESASHGTALNWAYYNFISKRKFKYFGFIDHDIYPIKKTSIIDKLQKSQNGCYGSLQEKGARWYLWAGFCFFSFSEVCKRKLNFMNGDGLDTGGMNWPVLYKHIDKKTLLVVNITYKNLTEGHVKQLNMYEMFDNDWIHSINAGKWFTTDEVSAENKKIALENLLKSYL